MSITFTSHLFKNEGNVWDVAIYVPKNEAAKLKDLKDRRILCSVNGNPHFHCALMPQGNGNFFINTNAELRKKINLNVGDMVNIRIEKDESKYGMPLPEELETAWELDPEGYEVFHTLTMGKQRSLIYQIGKTKSSEVRIKKALTMLEYLKSVNGNLDYKELNEAYKQANHK
jgi:bifunctional DNA-binding transcriptional regulator/antitoxin component of YhaV-PrlF toxin-antitoxin module